GTGKTWTIAVLYLRLLLECSHGPRQIVVATFSIAAAQELRERIRARLLEAATLIVGFDSDAPVRDDDGAHWLHTRWSSMDASARVADRNRLALALAELDLAPIGTLHSLCRKILAEHPFDSCSAFDPGEPIDSAELDGELREDLWRRLAQSNADSLDAGDRAWFAVGRKGIDAALRLATRPGVSIREIDPAAIDEIMRAENAGAIRAFVGDGSRFARSNAALRTLLEALAGFIEANDPGAEIPKRFKEGIPEPLEKQFKASVFEVSRSDPVMLFAERALRLLPHAAAPQKATALARYRHDLLAAREQRLLDRGQLTYDTLIERALAALTGSAGSSLADRLREAWPVALVDEFQDTDAQQFAILDRIYSDVSATQRGRVVMIGDPKQAIYGFRGGDVQAYLDASATATHTLRITTNFRSTTELVAAFNELFELAGPALSQASSAQIAYAPVIGSGRRDKKPLTVNGAPVTRPLTLHISTAEKVDRDDALRACASQIAGMLDGRDHRIGEDVLQPGDIAVLLPWNRDVERLRILLAARGVPCVGAGKGSVFATDVARELQVLLYGIEHAADETLVRAALATRFIGLKVEALRDMLDQAEAWQRHAQQFARWRQQWRTDGVLAVIQSVVAANATQLSAGRNAERLLTDVRHLGEVLQQKSDSCDGPASLLAWFAEQRNDEDEGDAPDERQLRIESDARRVQLMTVHASKGLQFPIVFLPLLDADEMHDQKLPLVRDADSSGRLLDLGSAHFQAAQRAAMFDEQDEAFRKLYVALTRAEYACHVYASARKVDGLDPKRAALSALLARLYANLHGRSVVDACAHIGWSETPTWPWSGCMYSPDAAGAPIERRALALPTSRAWEGRYSFSALTRQAGAFEDSAASDEDDGGSTAIVADAEDINVESIVVEAGHAELVALSAHKGENFGIALHAIFEQRRLDRPMREQHELVRRCMVEAGERLDGTGADALIARIATRVQAALDAPLLPGGPTALRLSAVAANAMRAEMDFSYVLDEVSMQRLRAACAQHGEPDIVSQHAPHTLRGLMTGAIDLVFEHAGRFHVLDYKSNYLGDRLSNYGPATLRVEMDRHHYRFQALLYTVALDRYLHQRLPGYRRSEQLGETIYMFLRAVGLAAGIGVWAQRFDDGLIAAVDAVLANAVVEAAA
ncbi:MAG TPA: UvrD-helicase domain-containing protein, partial [Xanthomonadaceae bacterium]|nr:UvrD-helicase domain-containing protein [Xanthomonadaceae bacterium]